VRHHAQAGFAQLELGDVQARPARGGHALGVAVHARRITEQHVHRQVDRQAAVRRLEHQPLLGGGDADHGEHGALAPADRLEVGDAVGGDAQHVALLGLVRPQLHGRERRIVAGDLRHLDHAADVGVVQQFGDGVGQAAGADVVRGEDGVALALGEAAVDHFLAAALHLGVLALHGSEVEVLGTLARVHRRRGATAEADQHRRPAQHHHGVAGAQVELPDLAAVDRAEATGQHDRLVVGAGQARLVGGLLEAAEVARQRRPAELIVEGRGTDRALGHDLERGGHARVQRAIRLPGPRQRGDAQVRDREAGEAGLGLAAATGGALVADLAAGAGGRAREGRDGGRVVVGLDLDAEGRIHRRAVAVLVAAGLGAEAGGRVAFDDRCVVLVRGERELRRLRVRVLDHPEQRQRLRLAVDGPVGVEDLVAAVLGIGLREHHQLGVGRIAAELGVAGLQVLDLVGRQGQAQAQVRRGQGGGGDAFERARGQLHEQLRGVLARGQQRLRHRVVQRARQLRPARVAGGRQAGQVQAQAALDPLHRQAGTLHDLGGLARPGRQRAQARHHVAGPGAVGERFAAGAALEDAAERRQVRRCAGGGLDEVGMPGPGDPEAVDDLLQAVLETVAPEGRQGRQAL